MYHVLKEELINVEDSEYLDIIHLQYRIQNGGKMNKTKVNIEVCFLRNRYHLNILIGRQ